MGTLVNGVKSVFGSGKAKTVSGSPINQSAFTQKLAGIGPQEELRKRQLAQASRLENVATGQAPSLATAQMKQASDRSLAQQLAASQAQRGGNAASRERMLARSQSQAGRDLAQQSGIAKIKEQQMAESSLAQQLQAQRGQDIGLAGQDIASQQALEQLKMKQSLGLAGINQQAQAAADKAGSDLFGNVISGGASLLAKSDKNCKKNIKAEGIKAGKKSSDLVKKLMKDSKPSEVKKLKNHNMIQKSDKNCKKNIKTEFAKGAAAGKKASSKATSYLKGAEAGRKSSTLVDKLMTQKSDKNCKKNIEDFNPKSFLDKLQAYSYDYKNPKQEGAGEGRHLSVMAQDLEKAGPVGRSMIEKTADGTKAVNYGKGFGAILAAQADLNQRMSEFEKKKNKK